LIASAAFGLAAVVAAAALLSAFWLRRTDITVHLPGLPAFWQGRSVALVSDIHLGNVRGAGFSRRLVDRLGRLGAECILVGGDVFDGVKTDIGGALGPWAGLKAPSGVFFVGGNHDDYGGRHDYFAALRAVGLHELGNTKVDLHGIQLVGVHDQETHSEATYRQVLEAAHLDPSRPSILLAHRPENLAVPESAGISLQLSGHTHGGQFWPWTHIVKRVHGEFAKGLGRFGRMLVFTSTGAGTWGPPFRLGTRAEIVLIRLEPA
jgi:predicted MPP superfamily phosphohydrolase